MPSVCRFELNKPNVIYFSGETIAGTIYLSTTSDKSVRDVSILFLGEGKVRWEESSTSTDSNGNSTTNTTYYRSHEVYINNSTLVHGEGNLPAGLHTYSFVIPLPWECPTSIEGKYGHVRYELSLRLNRYLRFDNIYKQPITVIRTIDLNLNPSYKLPLACEEISNLCCWPCSSGKIMHTLKIPFAAYAPGQVIEISLTINNQSMSDTEGFKCELIKKVTFTSTSPSRRQRHVHNVIAASGSMDKCLRLTNCVFGTVLVIPSTPPSTELQSIICVEYFLKMKVHISGCHNNCEMKMPIIIGTIPIRESLNPNQYRNVEPVEQLLPTPPDIQPSSPPAIPPPPPKDDRVEYNLPPSYADLKPPSFVEAIPSGSSEFIDTDVDERNRIVGFKPLYPMYNVPSQQQ